MDVADAITSVVNALIERQRGRIDQAIISARLYGNATLRGVYAGKSASVGARPMALRERITDNVIQSVIDTATARLGQNKPRPYHLTSGGNYKEQRRAKKLNKFTEGIFYENKAYRIGSEAQRDAEIFGDGLIFVREKNGRVTYERVLSAEVWVDESEALYGKPRQMHWTRPVERLQLKEWVRESEQSEKDKAFALNKIESATPVPVYDNEGAQTDMVVVRESWHLKSGPKAKDGKHCVSIEGCLLFPMEDWPHDFFPFARFRWSPRPLGYWSQGLAEQLQNKQIEINKILWLMQRSMHMAGTYKVLLEDGSKIVSEHLSNEIGAIVKYRGVKPEWYVPQAFDPGWYQHYSILVQSCYERSGFPLQVATGQKPAGLNSGEAQRVYRDTTNERQKTAEELNQDAYMDLAAISIAIAREIAERESGFYEVKSPRGSQLEVIRMSVEDLGPDGFTLQCFPTSSLPRDPAGRLATVQEFAQAGFITPRQARKLMDFPDLEANESLGNASEELLTKVLDAICDEGEYAPPEPTDDLALGMELATEYLNRGRKDGLEEERLDMLRTWKAQAEFLMQMAMPPAPPPMPGGPALPGGMPPEAALGQPMAPPMSDLMPMAG